MNKLIIYNNSTNIGINNIIKGYYKFLIKPYSNFIIYKMILNIVILFFKLYNSCEVIVQIKKNGAGSEILAWVSCEPRRFSVWFIFAPF
jgi:hypothetical protein